MEHILTGFLFHCFPSLIHLPEKEMFNISHNKGVGLHHLLLAFWRYARGILPDCLVYRLWLSDLPSNNLLACKLLDRETLYKNTSLLYGMKAEGSKVKAFWLWNNQIVWKRLIIQLIEQAKGRSKERCNGEVQRKRSRRKQLFWFAYFFSLCFCLRNPGTERSALLYASQSHLFVRWVTI